MPNQWNYSGTGNSASFSANGVSRIELQRGQNIREIGLRINGSVTSAAAGSTVGKSFGFSAIDHVRVLANGSNEIARLSMEELDVLQGLFYDRWRTPSVDLITDTANPSIDEFVMIPMWSLLTKRTYDAFLPSGIFTSFTLEIHWAGLTSVRANATDMDLTVSAHLYQCLPGGPNDPIKPASTVQFTQIHSAAGVAANSNYNINIPVTGSNYRFFLIHTTDTSDDDADLIDTLTLKSGQRIFISDESEVIRNNALSRRFPNAAFGTNTESYSPFPPDVVFHMISNVASYFQNTWAIEKGWTLIDLAADDEGGEMIATTGLSELSLELETTASANKIDVLAMRYNEFKTGG